MQKSKGFTLIELLVVIAIIALLAAIMFPVFTRAKNAMSNTNCIKNLHEIGTLVSLHRMSNEGFPDASGLITEGGAPSGAIIELAKLSGTSVRDFAWCSSDPAKEEKRFAPPYDLSDSSYNYGYNYYGMVTTTSGLPFPVTTLEAAKYLYNSPLIIDKLRALFDPDDDGETAEDYSKWDLGIFHTEKTNPREKDWKPAGYYTALYNTAAPPSTIITFCPHHVEALNIFSILLISGEVRKLNPVTSDSIYGMMERYEEGINNLIDWRVNLSELMGKNLPPPTGAGISYYNPEYMPLAETFNIFLSGTELTDGNGWIDTEINILEGDLVMIRSRGFSKMSDTTIMYTLDADILQVEEDILEIEELIADQELVVNAAQQDLNDYLGDNEMEIQALELALSIAKNDLNSLKNDLKILKKREIGLKNRKEQYNNYAPTNGEPIFTMQGDPLSKPDGNGIRKGMLIGRLHNDDDENTDAVSLGCNGSIIAITDGRLYIKITDIIGEITEDIDGVSTTRNYSGWCELNIAIVSYR